MLSLSLMPPQVQWTAITPDLQLYASHSAFITEVYKRRVLNRPHGYVVRVRAWIKRRSGALESHFLCHLCHSPPLTPPSSLAPFSADAKL